MGIAALNPSYDARPRAVLSFMPGRSEGQAGKKLPVEDRKVKIILF
jgi:hypothetical protein